MSGLLSQEQLRDDAERALSNKDFAAAEPILARGMEAFPQVLDKYGDPFFCKEYMRLLLGLGRWQEAEALASDADDFGEKGWHHILFARALDAAGRKMEASTHWAAFQATRPQHPEARAALAGMTNSAYEARRRAAARLPAPFRQILEQVPDQPLGVMFDVGANVGQSCLLYRRLFPDAVIHAFEPAPDTCRNLAERVADTDKILVHNIALSASDGVLNMSVGDTSSMNRVGSSLLAKGQIEIEARRLDNFCKQQGIEHIDFLKIDTEGHDLAVLEGARDFLPHIDFIQCEASANRYNRFHTPFTEIFELLSDAGFYLFHIDGFTYEWGNGGYPVLRRFDPVFINGRVVGDMKNIIDR